MASAFIEEIDQRTISLLEQSGNSSQILLIRAVYGALMEDGVALQGQSLSDGMIKIGSGKTEDSAAENSIMR